MDRRFLSEHRLQISRRQARGLERPEPFAYAQGPEEGLLDGHLLVKRETDQQRHRI